MPARSPLLAVLVAAGAAVTMAVPVQASAAVSPVAVWEMNEPAGATVMHDSSGHGVDGTIGSEVVRHVLAGGRTTYRFPYLKNGTAPAHPEHLVRVADNPLLDPGTGTFAVTVVLRTTVTGVNVLQKGQSGTAGGFYKFEINRGKAVCLFRGSAGSSGVGSAPINDGAFHTVRCQRSGDLVTMTVDGRQVASHTGATGSIANSSIFTIGGKSSCNQTTVECDYFAGNIDRVQVDAG